MGIGKFLISSHNEGEYFTKMACFGEKICLMGEKDVEVYKIDKESKIMSAELTNVTVGYHLMDVIVDQNEICWVAVNVDQIVKID